MLMSSIIFAHGHGITQISMCCSDIIRKMSRKSEEDIWPHEESKENGHSDSLGRPKCSSVLSFAQYWKRQSVFI